MKKFVVSLLVILSALALFAVTVTPEVKVTGEVGFEMVVDENALDINAIQNDLKVTLDFDLKVPGGNLSAGLSVKPVDKDVALSYVEYKEEAWLLRYEPNAIKLSNYTINQFTPAEGALKFGLTKYNLSLELADLVAEEVDKHESGKFGLPNGWIFGAKYDLLVGEDLEGFAATAFKFEDKGNNRFSIQGNLTKSPLPGEEEIDLVFALLNEEESTPTTVATATNAYRVYVKYAYPVIVDSVTLKPHAYFKAQEGLKTVFAPEVAKDTKNKIDWPDAREIGAGFDLEANPAPFTVGVTDTFTINLLDMDNLKYSLNLKPYFEYVVEDFKMGVDAKMDFTFVSPLEYKITPHLYTVLGIDNLEVAGDLFYFITNPDDEPDANKFAYMANITYTHNVIQTGLHLGNEVWDDDDGAVGAHDLTDLHWYLFLKASLEF